MIRRWSCINETNVDFLNFYKFEKHHKINVFKTSVNFKRFTFKFTKFKRKGMARFKHSTNWLIYTNVIKLWSRDYMFQKHYAKVQFLNKLFINNLFVYNFNFAKIRNEFFFYNFNFFFSIWTKKSYFYFNKNSGIYFKNNNLTFIWYLNTPILSNSVIPAFAEWDQTLFPSNLIKEKLVYKTYDFSELFDFIFSINLKKIVEIRKILTIIYINNLNFKNVK